MIPKKPAVSVIIPTYNDAAAARRLLKCLADQTTKDFEIIISDADSKDGIDKVTDEFSDSMAVKLVSSPPKGPGAGRNLGAASAAGRWLLFLDADDEIDDNTFIKTLVSETEARGWLTSSAKMKFRPDERLFEKLLVFLLYRYQKVLAHTKKPVASGYCILTDGQLFSDNQGFNENIQFGEDYDYVTRTAKSGFGFISSTYYYVDMRRSREEGWRFLFKTMMNEVFRHSSKSHLEKNKIEYEFGKHRKDGH